MIHDPKRPRHAACKEARNESYGLALTAWAGAELPNGAEPVSLPSKHSLHVVAAPKDVLPWEAEGRLHLDYLVGPQRLLGEIVGVEELVQALEPGGLGLWRRGEGCQEGALAGIAWLLQLQLLAEIAAVAGGNCRQVGPR